MSHIDELRLKWAANVAKQEDVNKQPLEHARAIVQQIAVNEHAQYPQYDGYWSGNCWMLIQITRNVTTKGGPAFKKGDITIAKQSDHFEGSITAYSIRNGWNTSLGNKQNNFKIL